MAVITFETKSKLAVVYDYSKDLGFYLVWLHSTCANPKRLSEYRIKSIDGIKSLTALLRACKDPSNQFCPQPVQADNPPPASSHPTAGGNLLHSIQVKNNSIKFFPSGGSVTAVIELYGDKYTYHLPFNAYYKIKRIDEDCKKLNGYPMGIRRCLKLCKKLCYDANNERYSVA